VEPVGRLKGHKWNVWLAAVFSLAAVVFILAHQAVWAVLGSGQSLDIEWWTELHGGPMSDMNG